MTKASPKLKVTPIMEADEFRELFFKLSYHQTQLANDVMTELYCKAKGLPLPTGSEAYKSKREIINSYLRDAALQEARLLFRARFREIMRGDIALPSFKARRLFIRNRGFSLLREDGRFLIDAKVFTGKGKTLRLEVEGVDSIRRKSRGLYEIIERIWNGEYKAGTMMIEWDRDSRSFYVRIPYTFEPKKAPVVPGRVAGIDLGISVPLVVAFNDNPSCKFFIAEKLRLLQVKREFMARRREIQRSLRKGHREGKGSKYKKYALYKLTKWWDDFRRTYNHQLSRAAVDFILENRAEIVRMEDLSFGPKDTFLGQRWPIAELQRFIEYKLAEHGIEVRKVNPAYTSQRCSACGRINFSFNWDTRFSGNGRVKFKCPYCGFTCDPDLNAARNIAIPGIEQLIDNEIKKEKEGFSEEAQLKLLFEEGQE